MKRETFEKDYLTNLPNRASLYRYYAEAGSDASFHAMFLDVDNYKRVNDVYGHSMGDKLLICIADYIRASVEGFISRIGGDEFVILMDGSIPEAEMIENAERLIDGFQEMNFRKDILSLISLSVGIILRQPSTHDLDDVLTKCDAAMYQAKKGGKNRYTVYQENDKSYEIVRKMEAEMDSALKNGEFVVYLQPKVNMVSTEMYGAEALSRWRHAEEGIRLPEDYIPVFEKNGFIAKLDMYIFEEVCRLKASWAGQKYGHHPISVNMSRLHLYDKKFPEKLERIAKKYGVDTKELEIEMTEGTFIKDSQELIANVAKLKEKGFFVSLDDFGSEFTALHMLKDMPVDTVKIDQSFLQESVKEDRGKKVIRNIIALCKDLKMDVIVEGIETKEHVDFITSCGCQIAQGAYFAEPLPVKEFMRFANEYVGKAHDNYTFHLNGDLKSEDGKLEGIINGEGLSYGRGIYKDTKSLRFPGGPSDRNTVHIPAEAIVNDSYTISLWIKPKESHWWASALYVEFESGFCSILPLAWEGVSDFRIRDFKEVNGWYDLSACQLREHQWAHYVASYNAKTETAIAYINGQVVAIMEHVPTNRYVKGIILGGDVFQPSFIGNICELVIYNEAKDYDFVKQLHEDYKYKKGRENFVDFGIEKEE